ncbi:UbiA prenyltransferase family protein [Plantactinospora sp. S1510]|uniref:UbiA prenyltransferase family protein n=1 Tax=Plantactinospora alkalitolerans TaxID=2789879 RepID=A0ABS0H974_9ACTN|nr:UbiA prenyltransferase family protein [Plantactinospora alkalitolerans]MBF9134864.1 UbiA prenyltransferase family protein [Plantactinospora alkalitolerans]
MSVNQVQHAVRPGDRAVAWARMWRFHFVPLSLSAGLVGMTAPTAGATTVSVVVGLLFCIFGYGVGVVINDWFDRKADAVNAPDRPFVAGLINPHVGLGLTLALSAVLLVVAVVVAPAVAIWGGIAIAGHLVYTWTKGVPMVGNLANGVDMSLFTVLGAVAVRPDAGWLDIPATTWFQTALVAVVLSGFCLVGYFKDIEGDRVAGYRTLPVALGTRISSRIAVIFPVVALAAAAVGALAGAEHGAYAQAAFWLLLAASGLAFTRSLVTLIRAPEAGAYEALLWFTRATTLFVLSLGALREPTFFLVGAIPMMLYLELTLRTTRSSRQA